MSTGYWYCKNCKKESQVPFLCDCGGELAWIYYKREIKRERERAERWKKVAKHYYYARNVLSNAHDMGGKMFEEAMEQEDPK